MKRLILGVAAALMLGAGPAAAEGLPSRGYVEAPDMPFSWRGFYIGLHAGLANGNTQGEVDFSDDRDGPKPDSWHGGGGYGLGIGTDYELSGALYGVQAGWLGQWGRVVAGVEATYSGSNVQGNDGGCVSAIIVIASCSREVNWLATAVGRAGLAHDRFLIYGLAGVAWADVESNPRLFGALPLSGSETHVGWTAGFGLEWAFSDRVSARVEYAHIDLGDETHRLEGRFIEVPVNVALEMDTIRLGLNVKLGH